MSDEQYLCDGIYVSFDGLLIKLRAPRGDADSVIYLEPGTLAALNNYAAPLWQSQGETT